MRFLAIVIALSVLVLGCDEKNASVLNPALTPTAEGFVFVTTTDFQSGSTSVVWLDSTHTTDNDVAVVHSDAVARYFDGSVYVVNRLNGDNIQILDPADGFATRRQFSTGNGSDPHDIVVLSPVKAYVTRYNETEMWIVDPSTGVKSGTIDLSGLADGDGIPEMDHMIRVGNLVFVGIQRMDRSNWQPAGVSYVGVVDATADTLVDVDGSAPGTQPIALSGANPFSELKEDAGTGDLYVACAGAWGTADAGVEVIDPLALVSNGVLLGGAAGGGDITDAQIVSSNRGYAIVTDASFHTVLIAFDPQTQAVTDTVYAPGDFSLQEVELAPSGELFVADRSPTNPGLRIYDATTGDQITAGPIDVGLPPFDITFGRVIR